MNGYHGRKVFILLAGPASSLYGSPESPGGPRGDSGTDLRFPADVKIPPARTSGGLPTLVNLQIRARCLVDHPDGEGRRYKPYMIVPRSISRTPLSLANSVGIVDAGYQGPLQVSLRNHSHEPFTIRRATPTSSSFDPTSSRRAYSWSAKATSRGEGGFGSTGPGGAATAATP